MLTTLCYIENENKYLMLHRNKKEGDINLGKWIGVGGKLEIDEKPLQGIIREIKEETGFLVDEKDIEYRGIVIFKYNDEEDLFMYLYTCNKFSGKMIECSEGDLKWVDKKDLFFLNLWEGDKIFLKILDETKKFFYLTLKYENDNLISHKLEFLEDDFTLFEVFVPEEYVCDIVNILTKYSLINEKNYEKVYASIDVVGNWTASLGANPFNGKINEECSAKEKLLKFRVKKEFKELAYYLIKKSHPYEVPVINMIDFSNIK